MQTFNPDETFIIKSNRKLGKIREIILNILGFKIYHLKDVDYIKFRHKQGWAFRVKVKDK